MSDAGPVFEDAVGAQFLTAVLTLPSIVKERHDTLEFLNHIYIRHQVRLVVAVDGLPTSSASRAPGWRSDQAWSNSALQTERGRIVVPLGDLDRHSRATTHVTDEADELVPLFDVGELNELLGGGLVAYAGKVLDNPLPDLVSHLRGIPAAAGANLMPADVDPQQAADTAFDRACKALLDEFGREGLHLLESLQFRLGLTSITSSVQLVIDVDPEDRATRVFTFSYVRPITPATEDSGSASRLGRALDVPRRLIRRSGVASLEIDLGPIGGCERYHLSAEAPFDTWFAEATMKRSDGGVHASEPVDTSQEFRLSYTRMSSPTPWSGSLDIDLRIVFTGVTRAAIYATTFLACCATVGLLRVLDAPDHTLVSENTDAAVALLVLFPGVAASAVATAARNTLTATLQFPVRMTLWSMSLASFVLAVATAFRLAGIANVIVWLMMTVLVCLAAGILRWRSRQWQQRERRAGKEQS